MSITWAQVATPWDNQTQLNAVIQIGSRIVIAGSSLDCLPGGATIYTSDDGGVTWAARPSPFDTNASCLESVTAFAYSAALDRLAAIGNDQLGINQICYSDDHGDTWTGSGTLPDAANCIARDDSQGLFVIGTGTTTKGIYTSPDAITWTGRTTPWDGGTFTAILGICFAGGTINKWVAVGCDDAGNSALTAPDPTSTWTIVASGPFDGPPPGAFPTQGGQSVASDGSVIVGGGFDQGAGSVPLVSVSPDAATWIPKATSLDGANGYAKAVAFGAISILVGGNNGVVESADNGASWAPNASFPIIPSTSSYTGCNGLSCGATPAFAVGDNDDLTVTAAKGAPGYTPIPPPETVYSRVYGIQIALSDDGVEQVTTLGTSLDGFA